MHKIFSKLTQHSRYWVDIDILILKDEPSRIHDRLLQRLVLVEFRDELSCKVLLLHSTLKQQQIVKWISKK